MVEGGGCTGHNKMNFDFKGISKEPLQVSFLFPQLLGTINIKVRYNSSSNPIMLYETKNETR